MGNELDLLGQWPFPREELEKMKEGVYIPREKFLIPKNIWHQGFNFGNENVQVLTIIAPSLWSTEERGTEIEYTKKPVRFMGRLQA